MKALSARKDPDPVLIQRAKDGDRDSLKALLGEVSPAIRQWAIVHTGDPDEAADLAQDVLILLVRKLPSFRGDSRFLTWLFTVTRNQALEGRRREGRQEQKMDRFSTHLVGEQPSGPAPDTGIDRGRIRTLVSAFLKDLPGRQREVFQMADFQGLSSPEIGNVLNIDPGSVRAALFKARRTLRKKILEQHPEFVEEYLS